MAYVLTRDGTKLYYKDWGAGQSVILIHGLPYRRIAGMI